MKQTFESKHAPSVQMSAHRHSDSYAALVLDGSYSEASLDGRYACSPGVLTVHPPWHTHANEFGNGGAVVLNFPMPVTDSLVSVRIPDPQALADLARRCPVGAGHAAPEEAECHSPAAPAPGLSRLGALLGGAISYWHQTAGLNLALFTDQASFSWMGVTFSDRMYATVTLVSLVQPVWVMLLVAILSGLWPAWTVARLQPAPTIAGRT